MLDDSQLPPDFRHLIEGLRGRRARLILEHILQHGFVTTEDIEGYGYKHPPRAARDVREQGVLLETFQVKNAQGKTIAAYRLSKQQADFSVGG